MTSKIQELDETITAHGGLRMASNDQDTQARVRFPSRLAATKFAGRAREVGAGVDRQSNPTDVVVTIR